MKLDVWVYLCKGLNRDDKELVVLIDDWRNGGYEILLFFLNFLCCGNNKYFMIRSF